MALLSASSRCQDPTYFRSSQNACYAQETLFVTSRLHLWCWWWQVKQKQATEAGYAGSSATAETTPAFGQARACPAGAARAQQQQR